MGLVKLLLITKSMNIIWVAIKRILFSAEESRGGPILKNATSKSSTWHMAQDSPRLLIVTY